MMNTQLIFLGAPGSGKGTQANHLVSKFSFNHISTGDLLRSEIEKESELGLKVKSIMASGNLVDDDTVLSILKSNCEFDGKVYIFDGYPRNIEQAKSLDEVVLKSYKSKAIYFEVNMNLLIERIVNRRLAPKSGKIYNLISYPPQVEGKCDISGEDLIHRKDDTEGVVRNRIEIFEENVNPILQYYESEKRLVRIDASLETDEISKELEKILND